MKDYDWNLNILKRSMIIIMHDLEIMYLSFSKILRKCCCFS